MILSTTMEVFGRDVAEHLGIVRGSSVRVRHVGRDVMARLKNLVGGEIEEYTKLLAECREQALDRMVAEARARGANAVVAVRFAAAEIMTGAAEVLCYGTAVRLS